MNDPDKQIASLAQDPRWESLKARGKERMDRAFNLVTHQFIHKNVQPDYGELQFQRGVFAGIKFLLDQPDLDAKQLAELLAKERGDE